MDEYELLGEYVVLQNEDGSSSLVQEQTEDDQESLNSTRAAFVSTSAQPVLPTAEESQPGPSHRRKTVSDFCYYVIIL